MRRLPLPLLTTVLAVGLNVLPTAPAWAHTRLVSSTPSQGGTAEAPAEVVLVFSEPVQAGLSAMSVRGADGEEQVAGFPVPGADDASVSQALRAPLEPGTYTVAYRVLAGDGHPVSGSFEVTAVLPAGAAPAGAAAPAAQAASPVPAPATTPGALAPAAGEGEDDGGLLVLPLVLAGLVVAGAGGLLARRLGGAPPS